jgi:hypothetical protein
MVGQTQPCSATLGIFNQGSMREGGSTSEGDHTLSRMCPSFSLLRQREGRLTQPLHIAHRGDAKEAFVLSIEVGGILVAHVRGRYFSVEALAQHQTTGLLQPEPLLELQGTQPRDDLEVVVQS